MASRLLLFITERTTDYGRVMIGSIPELFAQAVALAAQQSTRSNAPAFTWALSGGETPQAWYRWCVEQKAIPSTLLEAAHFTVSDERHVSLESPQSNYGNAARLLLDPLHVPADRRHPWPVNCAPPQSAETYRHTMARHAGAGRAYDVCVLGLGEDAHTASLFPGSPLLEKDGGELFVAVPTAEKGWRLTVTPTGLRACGLIVVMTLGGAKAPALRKVFTGAYAPRITPAQILKTCADRVVWLVDQAAAAGLV